MTFERVLEFLHVNSMTELWWVVLGLSGQLLFSMRFLIQWITSERARKSVIPVAFWYFSIAGGIILFTYAVYRRDPVFILGQATGIIIYSRNLYLIYAEKRSAA
ncbi:MAG: lipid-A-disaccharide synthase N-terminal domain-containing protein [Pseudomonadota bacterium]